MNYVSEWIAKIAEKTGQPGQVITGVLCMIVGMVVCFFGRRLLRPTLAVGGFTIGILAAKPLIETIHHTFDPESVLINLEHDLVRFVPFLLGVILAAVFMSLVSVGMYLMAAAGGMVLFTTTKDLINVSFGANMHPYVKIGILAVSAVLPLLLVKFLEIVVVSVCTATVGAAITTVGVDVFAKKGFFESLKRFWQIKDCIRGVDLSDQTAVMENVNVAVKAAKETLREESTKKEVMFMYGGFVAIAAAGALYQLNFGGTGKKKKTDL